MTQNQNALEKFKGYFVSRPKKPKIKIEINHPGTGRTIHFLTPDNEGFFTIFEEKYSFRPDIPGTIGLDAKRKPTVSYIKGNPAPLPIWGQLPKPNDSEIKNWCEKHFIEYHYGIQCWNAREMYVALSDHVERELYAASLEGDLQKWLKIGAIASIIAAGASGIVLLIVGGG